MFFVTRQLWSHVQEIREARDEDVIRNRISQIAEQIPTLRKLRGIDRFFLADLRVVTASDWEDLHSKIRAIETVLENLAPEKEQVHKTEDGEEDFTPGILDDFPIPR